MANTHAEKQHGEEKIHGDTMEDAVSSKTTNQSGPTEHNSAIPEPDNGSHARSQAAHLGGHTHDHTKPVGDLRHYEREREPPMEVTREGKEYRRQ